MRLSHDPVKIAASFDDPNLVSRAGLVPVMGLAERAGLLALAGEHVRVAGPLGANTAAKVGCLIAGIAHNLLRAAGALASPFHARARGITLRAGLIDVAARLARHGRGQLTLHLPAGWHCEHDWLDLFRAGCGPPRTRAA